MGQAAGRRRDARFGSEADMSRTLNRVAQGHKQTVRSTYWEGDETAGTTWLASKRRPRYLRPEMTQSA
jgi:hypothetical protein